MSNCEHDKGKCINTRRRDGYRLRRYVCDNCHERYSSVEVVIDRATPGVAAISNLKSKYGLSDSQERAVESMIEAFSSEK